MNELPPTDNIIPAVKKLGQKGKDKFFKGIKNYIETIVDFKMGKTPQEDLQIAEIKLKEMIDSLEWQLE